MISFLQFLDASAQASAQRGPGWPLRDPLAYLCGGWWWKVRQECIAAVFECQPGRFKNNPYDSRGCVIAWHTSGLLRGHIGVAQARVSSRNSRSPDAGCMVPGALKCRVDKRSEGSKQTGLFRQVSTRQSMGHGQHPAPLYPMVHEERLKKYRIIQVDQYQTIILIA